MGNCTTKKCGVTDYENSVWRDPNIKGDVSLDAGAVASIIEQLCPGLKTCVLNHVEGSTIGKMAVKELKVATKLQLNAPAKNRLIEDLLPAILLGVFKEIDGKTLSDLNLINATLDENTVAKVFDSIMATPAMVSILKETFTADAVVAAVKEIESGKALDGVNLTNVVITAGELTSVELKRSTMHESHLTGGVSVFGEIVLDAEAAESIVRTAKNGMGIDKLMSSDGLQLDGTEGLVVGATLEAVKTDLEDKIAKAKGTQYRSAAGELLPAGTEIYTKEEADRKFTAIDSTLTDLSQYDETTKRNTENLKNLTELSAGYREATDTRVNALEEAMVRMEIDHRNDINNANERIAALQASVDELREALGLK